MVSSGSGSAAIYLTYMGRFGLGGIRGGRADVPSPETDRFQRVDLRLTQRASHLFAETGLRDWLAGLNYQARSVPAIVRHTGTATARPPVPTSQVFTIPGQAQ